MNKQAVLGMLLFVPPALYSQKPAPAPQAVKSWKETVHRLQGELAHATKNRDLMVKEYSRLTVYYGPSTAGVSGIPNASMQCMAEQLGWEIERISDLLATIQAEDPRKVGVEDDDSDDDLPPPVRGTGIGDGPFDRAKPLVGGTPDRNFLAY